MGAAQAGGYTAEELLRAIRSGDTQKVRELLRADPALIHVKASDGATAILLSIYYGHAEMIPLFVERGAELDFFEACAAGNRERAELLLERDPSLVTQFSADGYPAFGLAIFFGHDELAELLLARGADVNAAAKNAQRVAPLHAAVAQRNVKMVRLLLSRGAEVDAAQAGGFTPLHGAAFHGDREIAELLVNYGADPNKKTGDGKTAADLALDRGHRGLAEWLKQKRGLSAA